MMQKLVTERHNTNTRLQNLLVNVHGLLPSLVIVVAIGLAGYAGFFTPLDGFVYDLFVRHSPEQKVERKVALLYVGLDVITDPKTDWEDLAERMIDRGARQVVFTFSPSTDPVLLARLAAMDKVTVGADIEADPENPTTYQFKLPQEISEFRPDAVSTIIDPLLGVHRYQRLIFFVKRRPYAGIEAAAAQEAGIALPKLDRYLVDFRNPSSQFPHLSYEQAMGEGLVDAIVRNRVVLIGPKIVRFYRNIATPFATERLSMGELEYHGFAADTLLRKSAIYPIPDWTKAILIAVTWLFAVVVFQYVGLRKAALIALTSAICIIGLAAGALALFNLHIPVIGALLALLIGHASVMISKSRHHQGALFRLANDANLMAGSGNGPSNALLLDDSFWDHVLGLVDQTVPLDRVILLELPSQKKHLEEVRALRCSIKSISEKRRDIGRMPYTTAIASRGTIEVRAYLTNAAADERQFLTPLMAGNEVLGFWAFSVTENPDFGNAALMHAVDAIATQLSRLLYQRQLARSGENESALSMADMSDRLQRVTNALALQLEAIGRRIDVLEDVFNGLHAPTALYDVFGRLLLANLPMRQVLRDYGEEEQMSAASFLERIGELGGSQARTIISNVIFNGHAYEQTVSFGNSNYMMVVSTLRAKDEEGQLLDSRDTASPLDIHGLMVQLFRISTDGDKSGTTLLDLSNLVEKTVSEIRQQSEHGSVNFSIDLASISAMPLKPARHLDGFIVASLRLLAADSRKPGLVKVTAEVSDSRVAITLCNKGYGIPRDVMQDILAGRARAKSPELRLAVQLREQLMQSVHDVEIDADAGQGYVVRVAIEAA